MPSREECEKEARENRALAKQAAQQGNKEIANRSLDRAIEWEKQRDSWFYRVFGW